MLPDKKDWKLDEQQTQANLFERSKKLVDQKTLLTFTSETDFKAPLKINCIQ